MSYIFKKSFDPLLKKMIINNSIKSYLIHLKKQLKLKYFFVFKKIKISK